MAAADPPRWDEPFVELYRARYDAMVRLAYLLTGDRSAAEELAQDAFVSVHRNWGRASNPNAYLRTAVVNACRSWGRRKVLERDRRPAPAEPSLLVVDELWDTLRTLPVRQRTAVVLRFYEDLPDHEIAEVLGCRQGTVRTLVHRGLAALKEELS